MLHVGVNKDVFSKLISPLVRDSLRLNERKGVKYLISSIPRRGLSHVQEEFFVCFDLRNSEGCFDFSNTCVAPSLPPRAQVATAPYLADQEWKVAQGAGFRK
jgi:hypothetical protein